MKLLFAIPHFYEPKSNSHGSFALSPNRRIVALSEAIVALHQNFGNLQCEIDISRKAAVPANGTKAHNLEVAIFTTGGRHLLEKLPIEKALYRHVATDAEPRMLGFECHRYLRESLGKFDYYCFMEDDLVIQDPQFFEKLAYFNAQTGVNNLLQPNRYELSLKGPYHKAYVDGDIRREATVPFQNVDEEQRLEIDWLGQSVAFRRPTNPHSGCFFLTQQQMHRWAEQPFFLDRCIDFVGPLESAASLGVMRAFRVYKPARSNANFLEIRHADRRFIHLIGNVVSA